MRSLRVTFFAAARDAAGCESAEISWDGDEALTIERFWTLVETRFPRLAGSRSAMRLARNLEYVDTGARLVSGDEVAVIPPVSGG